MSLSAFSIFLSCTWKTLRCILSIFKRYGPSVAQSLYIKRQGVCYFPPPFRDARWLRVVGQTAGISIIWICYRIDIISSRRLLPSYPLYVLFPSFRHLRIYPFQSFSFFPFLLRLSVYLFAMSLSLSSFSFSPSSATALPSSIVT